MKIFYGWNIAVCAMLVLWVSNGLIIPGITAFDPSLLEEFGWSRGTLKFRDLITFALAGLLGPLAGAAADRYGVRRFMLFGAALLAVCMVLYGRITSVMHMYAIHALFAVPRRATNQFDTSMMATIRPQVASTTANRAWMAYMWSAEEMRP